MGRSSKKLMWKEMAGKLLNNLKLIFEPKSQSMSWFPFFHREHQVTKLTFKRLKSSKGLNVSSLEVDMFVRR